MFFLSLWWAVWFSVLRYISMGVAADCKELCKGVVLVNSAGKRWHIPSRAKLL